MQVRFENGSDTEIVVDSGAEENLCPVNWGAEYGLDPPMEPMAFRSASGNWMNHYGQRDVVMVSPF